MCERASQRERRRINERTNRIARTNNMTKKLCACLFVRLSVCLCLCMSESERASQPAAAAATAAAASEPSDSTCVRLPNWRRARKAAADVALARAAAAAARTTTTAAVAEPSLGCYRRQRRLRARQVHTRTSTEKHHRSARVDSSKKTHAHTSERGALPSASLGVARACRRIALPSQKGKPESGPWRELTWSPPHTSRLLAS